MLSRRTTIRGAMLAICMLAPVGFASDAWCVQVPAGGASAPGSVPDQVQALQHDFQTKQQAAFRAIQDAKTDQERNTIYLEKAPKPLEYVKRAIELADQAPRQPAEFDALNFAMHIADGSAPELAALRSKALHLLATDQLDNPQLDQVFALFRYSPSKEGEQLLRDASQKSTHRNVRGTALFWLAQALRGDADLSRQMKEQNPGFYQMILQMAGKQTADALQAANPDDLTRQAEDLLEKVASEYGDVEQFGRPLGKTAKALLYAIRNLDVGKQAPEIEGKDADDKPMKLSDFKGKVVVLDFWGDW